MLNMVQYNIITYQDSVLNFFPFSYLPTHAQNYNWAWTINGGSIGIGGLDYQMEQIFEHLQTLAL